MKMGLYLHLWMNLVLQTSEWSPVANRYFATRISVHFFSIYVVHHGMSSSAYILRALGTLGSLEISYVKWASVAVKTVGQGLDEIIILLLNDGFNNHLALTTSCIRKKYSVPITVLMGNTAKPKPKPKLLRNSKEDARASVARRNINAFCSF